MESYGKLPRDSFRMSLSMAFLVEGMTFYGHSLEQEMTEATLHRIMVTFSFGTAFFFFLAARFPTQLLPQAAGIILMMTKGVWFFIVARILFSGIWGYNGMQFMAAMCWTVAGMLMVVMFALFGAFIAMRYDQDFYESSAGGNHLSNGKYATPEEVEKLNGDHQA